MNGDSSAVEGDWFLSTYLLNEVSDQAEQPRFCLENKNNLWLRMSETESRGL